MKIITGSEALQLQSARLTEEERDQVLRAIPKIDEHIRENMTFSGVPAWQCPASWLTQISCKALCFVFDLVHGIDCGATYEFAQIGGTSSAAPSEAPMPPINPAVAHLLQRLCSPSAPFPLLWYFVHVTNPVTGASLEVVALVDSGVSMSAFVGAGTALHVASAGSVTLQTIAGPHSSPWGFFAARLADRAVKGPDITTSSGKVRPSWLHAGLVSEPLASAGHQLSARVRAFVDGSASVIGLKQLAAWGLTVDAARGLVQCYAGTPVVDNANEDDLAEIWYEVEVTNPADGKSALYTALVDTGAVYSAFPSAAIRLGALPGGYTHAVTHGGLVKGQLGVLGIRLLRRAHRDFGHDDPFTFSYDTVSSTSEPFTAAVHEIPAKLDAPFALIGLSTIAAWGLQLHPTRGLIPPCDARSDAELDELTPAAALSPSSPSQTNNAVTDL